MIPSAGERGLIWGLVSMLARFLALPFRCPKAERPAVYLLYGTAWLMFIFAVLVIKGIIVSTETTRCLMYLAVAITLLLIFVLGHWGDDVEEIGEKYEDPIIKKLEERF
jgi:amino acid transporter